MLIDNFYKNPDEVRELAHKTTKEKRYKFSKSSLRNKIGI